MFGGLTGLGPNPARIVAAMSMANGLYRRFGGTAYMVITHLGSLGEVALLGQWLGNQGQEEDAETARKLANLFAARKAKISISIHAGYVLYKDGNITIIIMCGTSAIKYAPLVAVLTMYYVKWEELSLIHVNLAGDIGVSVATPMSLISYIGITPGSTTVENLDITATTRIRVEPANLWIYVKGKTFPNSR